MKTKRTALFQALLLSMLALVVTLTGACATAQPTPDAPWIGNLKFTPSSFAIGETVEISFEYKNIRGGLTKSQVILDYQGSLSQHTRKSSAHAGSIPLLANGSEHGIFRAPIRLDPYDPPPFDIWYFLRVIDAEGRSSNETTGKVSYKKL